MSFIASFGIRAHLWPLQESQVLYGNFLIPYVSGLLYLPVIMAEKTREINTFIKQSVPFIVSLGLSPEQLLGTTIYIYTGDYIIFFMVCDISTLFST